MFLEEKYRPKIMVSSNVATGGGGGGGGPNKSKLIVLLGFVSLYLLNRRFI
jgi:hypothetical protein